MDFQQVIIYTCIDIPNSESGRYKTRQSNHNTMSRCLTFFAPTCVFAKHKEDQNWNTFSSDQRKSIKTNFYVSSNITSNAASLQNEFLPNSCNKKNSSFRYKVSRLNFMYIVNI